MNHIHRAISFCISCQSEIQLFRLRIEVNSFGSVAVSMHTTLPQCCLETKVRLYIGAIYHRIDEYIARIFQIWSAVAWYED